MRSPSTQRCTYPIAKSCIHKIDIPFVTIAEIHVGITLRKLMVISSVVRDVLVCMNCFAPMMPAPITTSTMIHPDLSPHSSPIDMKGLMLQRMIFIMSRILARELR